MIHVTKEAYFISKWKTLIKLAPFDGKLDPAVTEGSLTSFWVYQLSQLKLKQSRFEVSLWYVTGFGDGAAVWYPAHSGRFLLNTAVCACCTSDWLVRGQMTVPCGKN